MKATGIVRRIDDLGRVVIPKEIRRTLGIRDGDPLEIFINTEGGVIFRKYSPVGQLNQMASELCDSVTRTCGRGLVVCDRDAVIAASGPRRREIEGRGISKKLDDIVSARQLYKNDPVELTPEGKEHAACIVPVLSGGDLFGCTALIDNGEPVSESELKLAQAAAWFLGRQMES